MKKLSVCLLAAFTAGTLLADVYFSLEKVPETLNISVKNGRDIDLKLEENAKDGYKWQAAHDAQQCAVKIEHKLPKIATENGAGAYADVDIDSRTDSPFIVTLNYVKTDDPNAKPAKTLTIIANNPANQVQPAATQPAAVTPAPAPAPAAAPEKATMLIDGKSYKYAKVPAKAQVTLVVGQDIDFDLEDLPKEGIYWRVSNDYDATICKVEIEHDDGGVLERAEAEIEIKGKAPGTTKVTFIAGSGENAKTMECTVTVQ